MPNALLVYPKNPITFWSFDEALKIAGKKSVFQPAGLLTVAGMLPKDYKIRVIDTNVNRLNDDDMRWADVVLTSSMIIHWKPTQDLIKKSNEFEKPILIGGPLATQYFNEMDGYGNFFLGEAEQGFMENLEKMVLEGYKPERTIIDKRKIFSNLENVPIQRFDLIQDSFKDYIAMAIQITRGCPEHCTFCNIPSLYGNTTRTKQGKKVLQELQLLHDLGWKGSIMMVDDNLVGNQESIMPLLSDVEQWQKEHDYPFSFFTQASLRMYDNPKLMEAMRNAGFGQVFFGLESPSEESLKFMGGQKNLQSKNGGNKKTMLEKIKKIQEYYFKAQAGFIIGFDTDPDNISELMKDFIQKSRISVAMVGPLGILPDTPDYSRYLKQDRLVKAVRYAGDSGIFTRQLSYIPHDRDGNVIDKNVILNRHREVVEYINSAEMYFSRTLEYLKNRKRKSLAKIPIELSNIKALFRSFYHQGIKSNYKKVYWNYLWEVCKNDFHDFADAISYAVEGHHLITTTEESLKVEDINTTLEKLLSNADELSLSIREMGYGCIRDIVDRYNSIKDEFKEQVDVKKYRDLTTRFSPYERA